MMDDQHRILLDGYIKPMIVQSSFSFKAQNKGIIVLIAFLF